MKKEIIEQLLERYWQCDTSLEEEKQLQEFFSGNKVPEDLKKYTPLFQMKNKQKAIQAPSYLKVAYEKTKSLHFYQLLKIAASFLIIVTLGMGLYTHYHQDRFLDMVLSETYNEPADAAKHTGEIMAKVSSLLQLIPEKVVTEESDTTNIQEEQKEVNDSLK
ncbi:MAG: hypothetical protein LIO93_08265 [Bacteroidales bacterium]|nr:hypothetical protein [Bacteroidales bacterium]